MRTMEETIDSRANITHPGMYTLSGDIELGGETSLSDACIRIESSDVVLDGAGHTIHGHGVSDTTGIAVTSSTELESVVVRNVTLTDWDRGIFLRNVTAGLLHDVHVVGNGYGISFENTRNVIMTECRVAGNLLGVYLDASCEDNTLRDNDVGPNHSRDVLDQSCAPTRARQRSPGRWR